MAEDGQKMTPEQVEELKEKLKNMSPEELREFQKKQCIFCHIVSGRVQAKRIYEDDKVLAVLDINPANPGHVLLLPKEHYTVMPQLPEDEIAHIFMVAKALSNSILRSLEAKGTNIIVANGPAAGQQAQHFMVHIIPRKDGDNLQFVLPQNKISEAELDKTREILVQKLGIVEKKSEDVEVDISKVLAKEPAEPFIEEKEEKITEQKKEEKKQEKSKEEKEKPKKETKKPKEEKKTAKEKTEKKDDKPKGDISLDDISRLLG